MKKRLIAAGCAASALLVSAAYAGLRLDKPSVFRCSANGSPVWTCVTRDSGKVQVFDPQGRLIGTGGNEPLLSSLTGAGSETVAPDARFAIEVAGVRTTVVGPGPHVVRDAGGDLLGTVVIGPFDPYELREMRQEAADRMPRDLGDAAAWAQRRDAGKPGAGVAGDAYTAYGYVAPAHVTWVARGKVKADLYCSDGTHLTDTVDDVPADLQKAANGYAFTPQEIATPQLAVTTEGVTQTYTGYGRHMIHGADGIDITLDLEPLQNKANLKALQKLRQLDSGALRRAQKMQADELQHAAAILQSEQSKLQALSQLDMGQLGKSGQLMSQAEQERLRAELQALGTNGRMEQFADPNSPEMKRLQSQLDQLPSQAEMSQWQKKIDQELRNLPDMRRLQSQLNQHELDSPEIKELRSPEFQKKLQNQVNAAIGQYRVMHPELRQTPPSGNAPAPNSDPAQTQPGRAPTTPPLQN